MRYAIAAAATAAALLFGAHRHYHRNPDDDDEESSPTARELLFGLPMPTGGRGGGGRATLLRQSDFDGGTYRIRAPGTYRLAEDVSFGPRKDDDYWPPFLSGGADDDAEDLERYPPAAYYLGFFAALTVEADDVTIDLNGHVLEQSEEFYLLQRFWNAIELNDRPFVSNDGVSSLNYQATDRPIPSGPPAGNIVAPSNVVIKNGRIGRASHSGIHGNGVVGLTVRDVTIADFEVSGIHCNGCKDVTIAKCEVGPSSASVPARAYFSHARFLDLYAQRLIPRGFAREPDEFRDDLLHLLENETMTYADRPGVNFTVREVFDRLHRGIELFRTHRLYPSEDPPAPGSEDATLLAEARDVFENAAGLPDGSVVYGVLLNRRGLPKTDENFLGSGRETANVRVRNLRVRGLRANPMEVAALATEDGTFLQGPVRDLIPIADVVSDDVRSLGASYYEGNLLVDAYLAFWKLSNAFYKRRVFASECGNFGSNATFAMNLKGYPSHGVQTCAERGAASDESLSGRDVTMVRERWHCCLPGTAPAFVMPSICARCACEEDCETQAGCDPKRTPLLYGSSHE